MTHAETTVRALIDACNRRDTEAAVLLFTDDAIYHNIPIAPARGHAEIRAMLGNFLESALEVDWAMHHIAVNGDVVMTERTDRFRFDQGWVELPVMGVFEVRGDRIAAWRDYFDMAPLQALKQPA